MDRSIEHHVTYSIPTTCIHSKNVYSLHELNPNHEIYRTLKKHLDQCVVCQKSFNLFQEQMTAIDIVIPKIVMDQEARQVFEREVDEVFKILNLRKSDHVRKNLKARLKFLDQMGIDFLAMLVSRPMIKAYALATFAYLVLKMSL